MFAWLINVILFYGGLYHITSFMLNYKSSPLFLISILIISRFKPQLFNGNTYKGQQNLNLTTSSSQHNTLYLLKDYNTVWMTPQFTQWCSLPSYYKEQVQYVKAGQLHIPIRLYISHINSLSLEPVTQPKRCHKNSDITTAASLPWTAQHRRSLTSRGHTETHTEKQPICSTFKKLEDNYEWQCA